MNNSDRIINAVIYGSNENFDEKGNFNPKPHPLHKTLCPCGEYVKEKDKPFHRHLISNRIDDRMERAAHVERDNFQAAVMESHRYDEQNY